MSCKTSATLTSYSAESSVLASLTPAQRELLTDILDDYLRELENGVPQSPEDLIREYADLAAPLRLYLSSLTQLHEVAGGFAAPENDSVQSPLDGTLRENRLGDFVLIREVGRGGMGIVYEARQLSLDRRVALKILPFAAILDSQQIARFKNEAQAAAQLHHTNIVPVFAVGSERGVHYYAMQFIDGQPLDRALEELQGIDHVPNPSIGLSTEPYSPGVSRLAPQVPQLPGSSSFLTACRGSRQEYFRAVARLGIQAAEGLHAAHGYGIIHRDIKPSNLLLDADGKLWITDFGLARCQNDLTLTRTGDVVGTRRYMSPEQAGGQAALIDHRTDIYSLGATLYELLTLRPAFSGEGVSSRFRGGDHRPVPPRHFEPRLPLDLETVVLKAMAPAREERYLTAQDLADDLHRVLAGKPTVARPPTIPDRMGKWIRRHSQLVAALATIAFVALLGVSTAAFLVVREKNKAEANFDRAERHYRQARGTVDRFGAQLADRLAELPGSESLRRELLQDTLQYYQDFAHEAGNDPELRSDLAMTYSKIGTLTDQLGSLPEAIVADQNALATFEQLATEQPSNATYAGRLAMSYNNLGMVLARAGRVADARSAYQSALRLAESLAAAHPELPRFRRELALAHNNLGLLQIATGEAREARASFDEAVRLQEDVERTGDKDPELLRAVAVSYNNLGGLSGDENPTEAVRLYLKASQYQSMALAAHPEDQKSQSEVARTLNNLGAVQSRSGQLVDATESYQRAIELQRKLLKNSPLNGSFRRELAVSYNNLGLAHSKLRESQQAEESFREALGLQESLCQQNSSDVDARSSLGGIYNNLGIVMEELKQFDKAAEAYKNAIEHQQLAHLGATSVEQYRTFLSKHLYNYGRVLRQLGKPDEAARAALARKKLWPHDPQRLFAVAEELALSSKLMGSDSENGAEQCADWAIQTLRESTEAGFQLPAQFPSSETFRTLNRYAAFATLMKK